MCLSPVQIQWPPFVATGAVALFMTNAGLYTFAIIVLWDYLLICRRDNRHLSGKCDFGEHREHIVPPYAIFKRTNVNGEASFMVTHTLNPSVFQLNSLAGCNAGGAFSSGRRSLAIASVCE